MTSVTRPTKFCSACGSTIDARAEICPRCGVRQLPVPYDAMAVEQGSHRRILPAAILCFLFGVFGVHRFYVGKIGTGLLQLFTLGGLGIWMMIDLIMIVVGAFRDDEGRRLTVWF